MNRFLKSLLLALGTASLTTAQAQSSTSLASRNGQPQVLYWMSNGLASVNSFMEHKAKIGIIAPTWYQIDGDGLVTGAPQPLVQKAAHGAHVTLIPLFALFNPEKAHHLVNDLHAQDEMNQAFIRECRENGYAGINFDIEDILWTDRDQLSALVKRTAEALHKEGLLVTIDVVPGAPGMPAKPSSDAGSLRSGAAAMT